MCAPDATEPDPVPLWENVYVGGLLEDTWWTRLFFTLTKRVPPRPAAQRSALATALLPPLLNRAFPSGMVVLTDYRSGNDDAKRAADRRALREREGGVLGVTAPAEVVVGIPDPARTLESWERFLAPLRESADGLWRVGVGPALRVDARRPVGIAGLKLTVTGLARAEAQLGRLGLAVTRDDEILSFDLPGTGGLSLQLTERADQACS